MKSSSGEHFIGLDHVRALAVFLVFTWHFLHAGNGYPVSFDFVPALFPFSILNEGHTGVSLFMTLSGYLFAKLLDGKAIDYRAFLRNRALRLLPLLALVVLLVGVRKHLEGESLAGYLRDVAKGPLLPTLPNGGWSITVEFHYYLILPLFLALLRRSRWLPLAIVGAAAAVRLLMHMQTGEVQSVAYWTIYGRVDQFALGMLAFQFRRDFARRHLLAAAVMIGFGLFYWQFDRLGGFRPAYNSPSMMWIILPTVEGFAYAALIAWYDSSFAFSGGRLSRAVGRIGEYSYSIYLLHFFFVNLAADYIHRHVMDLSDFYLACLWAALCFPLMIPLGYLSFRFVEAPFLKLRRPYASAGVAGLAVQRL